jgi:DNA polymerase
MRTVFMDFETFYSDEFTLKKLTPVEYILDPRFEVNGVAIIDGDEPAYWLDGPDIPGFFAKLDAKDTCIVTHNALFDMCIVAWHYGFVPRLMVDTMGLARATLACKLRSMSLDSVSQHLGLGRKGGALAKVKGMNLAMIKAAGLHKEYVDYGIDDVTKCAGIYKSIVVDGKYPVSELVVMDTVLRCAVLPQFQLDPGVLAEHLADVRATKAGLLAQAMLLGADGKPSLMSNEQFASLLLGLGVEPPKKISPVTGREMYAFAKTDGAFLDLQEHENPAVQVLVQARLGHKSTLEESRTERFIKISQLQWPGYCQGNIPVPLRYSGAHTHRLAGDWSFNMQNLPRGGNLRRALTAPQGYKVLKADSSQIEARGVGLLCGQTDLVEAFAKGEDVYSQFASMIFDKPVNKREHPVERFIGKEGILSLGYGAGAPKYQSRLKSSSKNQTGTAIELPEHEAMRVVQMYRSRYAGVPGGWKFLGQHAIPALAGIVDPFDWGPVRFEKGSVLLPSGLRLYYHELKQKEGGDWWFMFGGIPKKLYGGKLLENICQALARIVIMDAAVRVRRRTRLPLALQAHDELVYVVPDEQVTEVAGVLHEEMVRRPLWAPDWPLAAELGVGQNYGSLEEIKVS